MTVCVCWLTQWASCGALSVNRLSPARGRSGSVKGPPRCRSRDKGHWREVSGRRSIAAERQPVRLLKILEQETAVTTVTTQRVPAPTGDEPWRWGLRNGQPVGGKGAGLAEMSRLGLPVPPGFIITTEACRAWLAPAGARGAGPGSRSRRRWDLEHRAGPRFGDPAAPLLVSVRSEPGSRCRA